MNKEIISALVREDLGKKGMVIKTIVMQDLLWPNHTEVRAYDADGNIYSALYELEDKVTKFVMVPLEKK